MTNEDKHPEQDPAEGSRETIEKELARNQARGKVLMQKSICRHHSQAPKPPNLLLSSDRCRPYISLACATRGVTTPTSDHRRR
jgi:hypothetical protein